MDSLVPLEQSPSSLYSQASALMLEGRFQEASLCFAQIVDLLVTTDDKPALCVALNNLGAIMSQLGFNQEALEPLQKAFALEPDNQSIIGNLCAVLNALHQYDQVIALCEPYQNSDALLPETHNNLANAYKAMGQYPRALAHYRKAAQGTPHNTKVWVNLGSAAMHYGNLQEAAHAYLQAIQLAPKEGNHHRLYSAIHTYEPGDPHLLQMESIIAQPEDLTNQQLMELHFALGKAHDDARDYDQAFSHMEQGNKLKRSQINYDETATMALFDGMEQTMTAAFLAAFRQQDALTASPIFIIGMPRSGTTLIEQILSSIPGVTGLGERMDFQDCVNKAGLFPHLEAKKLGQAYLDSVAKDAPDAITTVDKMMSNLFYLGLIHLALPHARLIHVRRNPVDTCLSCYSHYFTGDQPFSYDLAELGRYYRRYERLMQHWQKVLPPDRYLEIDYENLVADFIPQAQQLVGFCGLTWSDECLNFHKTSRPVLTASAVQVRTPLYTSSVGRRLQYQSYLRPLLDALRSGS